MIVLIQNKLKTIHSLCEKHRIAKLWLFGSAVEEGEFTSESDLDFLFTYDDQGKYDPTFPYVDAFLALKKDLEELLNRKVDLIGYQKFRNPYFRKSVEESKVLIYEKESTKIPL